MWILKDFLSLRVKYFRELICEYYCYLFVLFMNCNKFPVFCFILFPFGQPLRQNPAVIFIAYGQEGWVWIVNELRNKRVFPIRNFITNSLHNTNEAFSAKSKSNNLTETIKNQNNTVHRWGDVPGSQLWMDQCHHIFFTCAEARKKSCSICEFQYFPKYWNKKVSPVTQNNA